MKPLTAVCRFEMGDRTYEPGDALSVSETAAQRLVSLGLAKAPEDVAPLPLADALASLIDKPSSTCRSGTTRRKAMSVCSTPGCPVLTESNGRCQGCASKARARRRLRTPSYSSPAWRRTRAAFLAAHPYCECPAHAGLPTLARPDATEVDHIDGLGLHGPRAFDWSNLRAMTKACHSRRTATDQPTDWGGRV